MTRGTIEITNRRGLHARAASKFVQLASNYSSSISLSKGEVTVDGKSILGILLLQAAKGTTLTLAVEGADEEEAYRQLAEIISNRFGEKK